MKQIEAPWAKLPLHLMQEDDLTLSDVKTYVALDYLCGKRGWWYGSAEDVEQQFGIPSRSVERATKKLEEHGYISKKRLGIRYGTVIMYNVLARTVPAAEAPDLNDRSASAGAGEPPQMADATIPQTKPQTEKKTSEIFESLCEEVGVKSLVQQPVLYFAHRNPELQLPPGFDQFLHTLTLQMPGAGLLPSSLAGLVMVFAELQYADPFTLSEVAHDWGSLQEIAHNPQAFIEAVLTTRYVKSEVV